MTNLKNSNCDKTQQHKLYKSICKNTKENLNVTTQISNMTTTKKMQLSLKIQNVPKHKSSSCEKTQKLKLRLCSKNHFVAKFKDFSGDTTQKLKF